MHSELKKERELIVGVSGQKTFHEEQHMQKAMGCERDWSV